MDKNRLRKSLKQARLDLAVADRDKIAQQIAQKLSDLTDWRSLKSIHIYEPIASLGEVDISGFYQFLKQINPDAKIYTSRKIADKWRITSIGGESLDELPEFDVIIVPMLGFDTSLHRIGYGGGYYDRLLTSQSSAQKIGVCYEMGRVDSLPIEPHDIPLDKIITEKSEYTISNE